MCFGKKGQMIVFFFIWKLIYIIAILFLNLTTLWEKLADDKWIVFFLFFPENWIGYFMQIVSITDTLHEISNPVTWEKNKDISKCHLLTILPRVLSFKLHYQSASFGVRQWKVTKLWYNLRYSQNKTITGFICFNQCMGLFPLFLTKTILYLLYLFFSFLFYLYNYFYGKMVTPSLM